MREIGAEHVLLAAGGKYPKDVTRKLSTIKTQRCSCMLVPLGGNVLYLYLFGSTRVRNNCNTCARVDQCLPTGIPKLPTWRRSTLQQHIHI